MNAVLRRNAISRPGLLLAALVSAAAVRPLPAQTESPAPAAAPAQTPALQQPHAPDRSNVYEIRDSMAVSHFVVDAERARNMVDRLVLAVTGQNTVAAAWRTLVEPKDVVGIKISATGGDLGSTHRAVVDAIIDGLRDAGVPAGNIVVWDRDAAGLRTAGYLDYRGRSTLPCAVQGIEPRLGYDPKENYTAPQLGKLIWGDLDFRGNPVPADLMLRADEPEIDPLAPHPAAPPEPRSKNAQALAEQNLSSVSHYCTVLSRRVTKIVNVPIFSDNYYCGLAGALYNVTIPNVDNWRRLVAPPQFGVTAIPELYSDPRLGGKIVLNITDGLVAQIAGGPYFSPLYARSYGTLYASRDAVALDSVVLRLLEGWRVQAKLPALGEMANHVKTAGDIGLGNYEPAKIDLRSLNR